MMWLQANYAYMRVTEAFRSVRDREEGQALVEYALILSLVAVVAIGILTLLGTDVKDVLNSVEDKLAGDDDPPA